MFTRQKKLQPLAKIMGDRDARPATPGELKAKVMALHVAFGGRDG